METTERKYYILKKKKIEHAVTQGETETLCDEPIQRGERGRDVVWFGQITCPACRKIFALSDDRSIAWVKV